MAKLLKPYTIIPSNLYIQRDADRQVRDIVENMGRPGYVLVSRQMGKTNLLLNAKRELESSNDVFVYVDLSNPFSNAKECFENIVDVAIETNNDKFARISPKIYSRRTETGNLPAHKLHTEELRQLLNSIDGKLVIILDEIDALTKTNYSDQIFVQIRSVYFSRINFPELDRLTYLLSGVVEPTDLIKDPKISPFNIGQKIFLNDFSYNEFTNFLLQAKIEVDVELANRIFYWSNGNPRITWDLLSEIETLENLTVQKVDNIVNSLYLNIFDKPPVDHIRELVRNDSEIRHAVKNILLGKESEIPDSIKSKLYLAGIINYDHNAIRIKNNIIIQSLSLEWIRSIENENKSLLAQAMSFVEESNYNQAIELLEKYVKNEFEDNDSNIE